MTTPAECETIVVVGAWTLIGEALVRRLAMDSRWRVLGPSAESVNFRDRHAVESFFCEKRPVRVYLAAGRSGGIDANRKFPADLCLDNLETIAAVLRAAVAYGCPRLLYLGSSCMYPRDCEQPMQVDALGTGMLEPTSAAYATAKLAGLALVRAIRTQFGLRFISGIPADVYGPCRITDASQAHVIPSLLLRMHKAVQSGTQEVVLWGTGTPRREFLHVDDLADACAHVMDHYDADEPINLGGGHERTIHEAAHAAATITGFEGRISFDSDRPDGMPRKLLDSSALAAMGWQARIPFEEGLRHTYEGILARNADIGSAAHAAFGRAS